MKIDWSQELYARCPHFQGFMKTDCRRCLAAVIVKVQCDAIESSAKIADEIAVEAGAAFIVGDTEVQVGRDVGTEIRKLKPKEMT